MKLESIILMIILVFCFSVLIIPFVIKIAKHIGAIDIPNNRKIHKKPMPRLGGLGIYASFLFGYLLFGEMTYMMNAILIGSFIILLTGIIDDISPIKWQYKMIGQLLSCLVLVIYGQVVLRDINLFGIYINFGRLSYLVTIIFIMGCINSMNFIDGLDGLAAGISVIFFLTIGIIAYFQSKAGLSYSLALTLTFIMFGSTSGFLVYNFYPAKLFMGDSGSMFIGYIMSIITILGFKSVMMSSIVIPLCLLVVPILDTLLAIIRRKLNGESVTMPDKSHIHHQLLRRNFTQKQTVLTIYLITILFSIASIIYTLINDKLGIMIYIILTIILLAFIFKTDVLFENKHKR